MDIFSEYHTADEDRRRKIEAELVKQHTPLAIFCAKNYFSTLGYDDAKQEALVALLRAIRRHKPQKGAFSTFAVTVISRHLQAAARRWQRWRADSLDAIAESTERRNEYERAVRFDDTALQNVEAMDILSVLRKKLSERQYNVLMRYLEGDGVTAIAEKLGISRQSIRLIRRRAKSKAQKLLG